MKKLVKEHLNEKFDDESDSISDMGIGKIGDVKKVLSKLYKDHTYLSYRVKDLDNIEIYFNLDTRYMQRVKNREKYTKVWVLKYVDTVRYFVNEQKENISAASWQSPHYQHFWEIYENTPIFTPDNPENMTGFDKKHICKLYKEDKNNEERAQVMTKALNEHFGETVWGFEYVKSYGTVEED